MFYDKYILNVVSQHPDFKGKTFKKFKVGSDDYIGVYGNEPFEIHFKNNTNSRVEVRLTLDGTDILTGSPASLNPEGQNWLVRPYENLVVKAWVESVNGGASFVFTDSKNSVASNTHGITSERGIIGCAVFTESEIPKRRNGFPISKISEENTFKDARFDESRNFNYVPASVPCSASFDSMFERGTEVLGNSINTADTTKGVAKSKNLASVGAGSYVNQKISYVTGLNKPVLDATLSLRYEWWNELKELMSKNNSFDLVAPGFPQKFVNLGSTPRLETHSESRFSY
jgi:hypothetical protein